MPRNSLTSLLLLCFLARPAHAVVVEIPLPGLLGAYPPVLRTTSFELSAPPSAIHGVSLRISGTLEFGMLDCEEGQFPTGCNARGDMWDAPTHLWSAGYYMDMAGYFSWTQPFETSSGATWNFLADGSGEITFQAGYVLTWCFELRPPTVTVTEAVLIVDAEFPVAIESSTWGKIKALYR
jgi:hypothetical protein